jgi:hypothetical protein
LPTETLIQLHDRVSRCLIALGVQWRVTHTEVKLTPAGPEVIEVNGRMVVTSTGSSGWSTGRIWSERRCRWRWVANLICRLRRRTVSQWACHPLPPAALPWPPAPPRPTPTPRRSTCFTSRP